MLDQNFQIFAFTTFEDNKLKKIVDACFKILAAKGLK